MLPGCCDGGSPVSLRPASLRSAALHPTSVRSKGHISDRIRCIQYRQYPMWGGKKPAYVSLLKGGKNSMEKLQSEGGVPCNFRWCLLAAHRFLIGCFLYRNYAWIFVKMMNVLKIISVSI